MVKRLLCVVLCLGLAAVLATPAVADCRVIRRCAPPVIVEKVAVVEAVAAVPIVSAFLPAAVVAYGAAYAPGTGYAGPPPSGAPGSPGPSQDAVAAALARLEQRLGAIEQRSGVVPSPAQTAPMPTADQPPPAAPSEQTPPAQGQASADVVKLFTTRCASCHQKGREGSGGGFVLLDGPRLAPLSAEKQREVLRQIYSQKMPKSGKPLSDEELGVVVSWLATN